MMAACAIPKSMVGFAVGKQPGSQNRVRERLHSVPAKDAIGLLKPFTSGGTYCVTDRRAVLGLAEVDFC